MSENMQRDAVPYHIFLCDGRILARNIEGRVIDIGGVQKEDDGFHWQFDGNNARGDGLVSSAAILDDIERELTFLFLDGQFTSLPDTSDDYRDRLQHASGREVTLYKRLDEDV